jgi:formylglycine-generating enzyme required for sulfatase activity
LVELAVSASASQFETFFSKLTDHEEHAAVFLERVLEEKCGQESSQQERDRLAKRQASAAVALLRLGRQDQLWPLLKHRSDPRTRSYLIHRLSSLGADHRAILSRLDREEDLSIRRALVLSLGEYEPASLASDVRRRITDQMKDVYRNDPDPGMHGAAEWLLRHWKREDILREVDDELATGQIEGNRRWYLTTRKQTMVVLDVDVCWIGGALRDKDSPSGTRLNHQVRIGRRFAISSKEVKVAEMDNIPTAREHRGLSPEPECPATRQPWFVAARYCNWLSKHEGIPKEQMCFRGFRAEYVEDYLSRTGYRLPTSAEWEYACRAGATTKRYYGETEELLGKYAWTFENAGHRTRPGGLLKPNDLGLFDMHGNVREWCQEAPRPYPKPDDSTIQEDPPDEPGTQDSTAIRTIRGSDHTSTHHFVRCDLRGALPLGTSPPYMGFRIARTFDP